MKIFKGIALIACFIVSIKADIGSEKIEEIELIKEDITEYGNADCVSRDVSYNERSQLDIYYDSNNINDKKPVVIQFHGGSWYNEDKMNCVSPSLLLRENNYVTVVPNFILFPNGQIDDMVSDFYEAIEWTFNNISNYGGDSSNISVVGFSSSAHVLALTLIKAALIRKNNNISLSPLPEINRVVLINGQYDYDESLLQTVTSESVDSSVDLFKEISLAILGSSDACPVSILEDYDDNSLSTFNVQKFNIVYSSQDDDVPESSATNLMEQMKRICPSANIQYIYLEGIGHNGIINGIRDKNESIKNAFIQLINL